MPPALRKAGLAALLLVVLAAVAAEAFSFNFRKNSRNSRRVANFNAPGREWTVEDLAKTAKKLGGRAHVNKSPRLYSNAAEVANRYFSHPKKADAGAAARAGLKAFPDKAPSVQFIAFDGKHSAAVMIPDKVADSLVQGLSTGAFSPESERPAGEHGHSESMPLALLEEGAGQGTGPVWGEGAKWQKLSGTAMDKHPVSGVVQMYHNGHAFCTGAVISKHLVLTAAHCMYDFTTGGLLSTAGGALTVKWKRDGASTKGQRTVTRFVVHSGFSLTDTDIGAHDHAVLVLDGADAPFSYFGYASNQDYATRKASMSAAKLRSEGDAFLHSTGYPGESKGARNMWCDKCLPAFTIGQNTATNRCDAEHGSSGGPFWYTSTKLGATIAGTVSAGPVNNNNLMAVLTASSTKLISVQRKLVGE